MKNELKTLYATGCSHTASGGLWWPQSKQWYKENCNISYENELDVSYVKYLADSMNLKWINTAKSGTGAKRLLRKTWQYIREVGLEESKKTLFILQINNPLVRLDFYSKELERYLVVNCRYDSNNKIEWIESCDSHPNPTKPRVYFSETTEHLKNHLEKHYDLMGEYDKLGMEMIGLISFFELNKIDYFIEATDGFFLQYLSDSYFTNEFIKKRIIQIDGHHALNLWAYANKKLIQDETNGFAGDNHAGLFAQKEWAEKLKMFIKTRI
jgi:hypothetical protein